MERSPFKSSTRIIMFLSGLLIVAWGFNALLMTNGIIIGGLPGFSLLVEQTTGIDPSVTQLALGIPLFLAGWLVLGRNKTLHSLAGALLLPAAIFLLRDAWSLKVESPILAAVFGGFTCGLGLGFIFRANATVGGFSILASIVSGRLGVPISRCMLVIDGLVVISAGVLLGAESAMLALLGVISLSKAIDLVQSGFGSVKSVTIITVMEKEMSQMLTGHLDCGATLLHGEGGYSGDRRAVIVTVVPRAKVARLRRNIRRIDPDAFSIISDASEVLGYGFQHHG